MWKYSRAHLVKGAPQAGYATQNPFGIFRGFAALAPQKSNLWYSIPLNPRITIFFKISALLLSSLYWPPTSSQVSEKTDEQSHEIFKDGTTDKQTRAITKDPIG